MVNGVNCGTMIPNHIKILSLIGQDKKSFGPHKIKTKDIIEKNAKHFFKENSVNITKLFSKTIQSIFLKVKMTDFTSL